MKVQLFNTYVYALVDSGSTLSLVRSEIVPQEELVNMEDYNGQIVGAEGSKLNVLGSIKKQIQIANKTFNATLIVVQNLQEPILIGTDFMVDNKCILNFSAMSFQLNDDINVPLFQVQNKKSPELKVLLSKTIQIPARTTVHNVHCRVKSKRFNEQKYCSYTGIYEPCEGLLAKKYKISSKDSLVNLKKGKTHIDLVNPMITR